jgi:hypothetical protein
MNLFTNTLRPCLIKKSHPLLWLALLFPCLSLVGNTPNDRLLAPTQATIDSDGDGIDDSVDNCPFVFNPFQQDFDGDGVGDACDNCVFAPNPDQTNSDTDALGDACDNCDFTANPDQADADGDLLGDTCDNCPNFPNSFQEDLDADGVGDVCDNCPFLANTNQQDSDGDGVGNACDNCPLSPNPFQQDFDGDNVGDACDNCVFATNADQLNSDTDALGDACDNCDFVNNPSQSDGDFDLVGDACDNCPTVPNALQEDGDNDAYGLACDCNDLNPAINPGAPEICDGFDNNCDGQVDETCGPCSVFLPSCVPFYKGYTPAILTASPADGTPPYAYAWSNGQVSQSIIVSPPVSTIYTVTVTDATGCISTASTLVEVVDVACGSGQAKVYVCHAGTTQCVLVRLVQAHLAHGDNLGYCNTIPCANTMVVPTGNLFFETNEHQGGVQLLWLTDAGEQTQRFFVEKSEDGISFQLFKEVDVSNRGNNIQQHREMDFTPFDGENFYRIRQLFKNGSEAVSEVRQARFSVKEPLSVFPNPASGELFLVTKGYEGLPATVWISNSLGQVLSTREIEALPAEPLAFDLAGFRDGVYFMFVEADGKRALGRRFAVQGSWQK